MHIAYGHNLRHKLGTYEDGYHRKMNRKLREDIYVLMIYRFIPLATKFCDRRL